MNDNLIIGDCLLNNDLLDRYSLKDLQSRKAKIVFKAIKQIRTEGSDANLLSTCAKLAEIIPFGEYFNSCKKYLLNIVDEL